jgi:hypothetical protein
MTIRGRLQDRVTPVLLAAFAVLGVSARPGDCASERPLAITEVRLRRIDITDVPPWDDEEELILRADGTASYTRGVKHQRGRGNWVGRLHREHFRRLTELIQAIGFGTLKSEYRGEGTHGRLVTTSVVTAAGTKRVQHWNDGGPVSLWGVERAILSLLSNEMRWDRPQGPPP